MRELEQLVVQEAPLKDFMPLVPFLENDNIGQQIQSFYKRIEDRELLKIQENVDKNNTYRAKKLNMQVQLDRETLLELVMANKKLLYEQLSEANAQLIEVENSLVGLPSKGREFNRINRLYSQFDQYYASLLNKRTEIKIAEAGIVPEFIILSPASLPQIPIAPVKFQFYAIAGALGFFLSLVMVAGRYLAHNTITNQAELERLVSAPVLGIIPEYRKTKLKHTKLVVSQNPKSSINEALRSVRTNLDYMLPSGKGLYNAEGCIVFSITSTISGEGKTFVASNLGGIIAMANLKVIILDFDMRKPKLHLAFNAENQQGVSSILIGKKTVEECMQPTEIGNLFFIFLRPYPPPIPPS
ncbi:MAG: hypothetical protein HC913_02545 [Microscillaceae bacterium]|nr:hypothetical protein [Microscillaceae bacterium]